MFKPDYRLTNHFLSLAEKIAVISSKINESNIKFSLMVKLQREAFERCAHSSTSIEGNVLSLAQVSSLSENRQVDADWRQKQEVINYLKSLRWIIKKRTASINKTHLLKLHSIITDKLLSEEKIGSFKKKQNYVVNEKRAVIYTPPSPKDTPRLVEELLAWAKKKDMHSIIQSAIFHHQLVNIHPFVDGNGRLARLGAQWLLYRHNFDPHHIFSLDDFFAQNRKRYYQKIQQIRELDYDFTYWIEYVAEGILETVEKLYNRIKRLILFSVGKITVTPKQEELINILSRDGFLSSSELCNILKINRARVNQLIVPLIKASIVKKEGKARATRYFLNK